MQKPPYFPGKTLSNFTFKIDTFYNFNENINLKYRSGYIHVKNNEVQKANSSCMC